MITYRVDRWYNHPNGILGSFHRSDEMICFTLEPPLGIPHPAIPDGDYPLIWEYSPRLKVMTPRLADVPDREGILIHAGNRIQDTEGCILVGMGWQLLPDNNTLFLNKSRPARDLVYNLVKQDVTDGGFAEIRIRGID